MRWGFDQNQPPADFPWAQLGECFTQRKPLSAAELMQRQALLDIVRACAYASFVRSLGLNCTLTTDNGTINPSYNSHVLDTGASPQPRSKCRQYCTAV